ncbi:MAG: TIGR00730 family Rossman fold protein [Bacteroidales bacterium]
MRNICVYCGSSMGNSEIYKEAAKKLAYALVQANKTLIYGGACCGTMGVLADEMLLLHGQVHGVMPTFFEDYEVVHTKLTKLTMVKSMSERKTLLLDISDAFVALPGSYGTMDELFETLALLQLKKHNKPVVLLNLNRFYDSLIAQLGKMNQEGFLSLPNKNLLRVVNKVEDIIPVLEV